MSVASGTFRIGRVTAILASIGGAKLDLLAQAPADVKLFVGRGVAAFIPAMGGFMTALVVVEDAFRAPLWAAIVAGLLWAAVVMGLDVTVMSTSMEGRSHSNTWKDWGRKTITFLSRLAISVLIAATLARLMLLVIYNVDITRQMAEDGARARIAYSTGVVGPEHAKAKAAAEQTIANDTATINGLYQVYATDTQKRQVAYLAWQCEIGGLNVQGGCPGGGTGQVGNGNVAHARYVEYTTAQTNEGNAKARWQQAQATLDPAIASAQSTLDQIKSESAAETAAEGTRIANDTGLIPRQKALGELESSSSTVREQVLLLELTFLAIDLFALFAATFVRTPSYALVLAAEFTKAEQATARAVRKVEFEAATERIELRLKELDQEEKVVAAERKLELAQIEFAADKAEATAKGEERVSRAQINAAQAAASLEETQAGRATARAKAEAKEDKIKTKGEARRGEIQTEGEVRRGRIQAEGDAARNKIKAQGQEDVAQIKSDGDRAAAEAALEAKRLELERTKLEREIAELTREIRQIEASP
jgi:uncharacterized protein DUF4407